MVNHGLTAQAAARTVAAAFFDLPTEAKLAHARLPASRFFLGYHAAHTQVRTGVCACVLYGGGSKGAKGSRAWGPRTRALNAES